jgi:hypothetical protein
LVKSISLRKLRPLRFITVLPKGAKLDYAGVAHDGAGHTARTAPSPTELFAGDGDNLDTVLAQHGVGGDVAFVSHHDTGSDGQVVRAVVPLLSLGGPDVLVGGEDSDLVDLQDISQCAPEVLVAVTVRAMASRRPSGSNCAECRSKNG